jgi:hypothetical protein
VAPGDSLSDAVTAALESGGPAFLEVLAPRPSLSHAPTDATFRLVTEAVEAGRFRPGTPDAATGAPDPAPTETPPAADTIPRAEHEALLARLRAETDARLAAAGAASRTDVARTLQRRLRHLLATAGTEGER